MTTSVAAPFAAQIAAKTIFAQETFKTPKILFIHCDGGWDQTMVFDPKIGIAGIAQESGQLLKAGGGDIIYAGHANRPAVQTFFDNHGNKSAIINGISCGSMNHESATRRELGIASNGRFSDYLSYYTSVVAPIKAYPHLVIDAPYIPGVYSTYSVRLTSSTITDFGTTIPATSPITGNAEAAIFNHVSNAWADVLKTVSIGIDGEKLRSLQAGLARESNVAASVVEITGTVYSATDSNLLKHGKMAVEFFKQDLAHCATIQAGSSKSWDTHSNNFSSQAASFQSLFSDLNSILAYATTAGIADDLIIIVTSELGRAPALNATSGKNRWPYTSALVWGAGIRGGITIGQTNDRLIGQTISPLFGTIGGEGTVPLEIAHLMTALFVKAGVPTKSFLAGYQPLSVILGD